MISSRHGMNSVENANLFESLQTKFGIIRPKKLSLTGSFTIGTLRGLDRAEYPRVGIAQSFRPTSAIVETNSLLEDAKVERTATRRIRPRSITNRWSMKKAPGEEVRLLVQVFFVSLF